MEHLDFSIVKIDSFSEINEEISKVLIILEHAWDTQEIKKFIGEFETEFPELEIVQYHTNVFSIGKKGINKGTAIKWLCNHLNIDPSSAIAIGDNFNDLPMFEVVGHPVVMDNAHEAVKSYAEWIAPNNDKHGVQHAINQFILNQQPIK